MIRINQLKLKINHDDSEIKMALQKALKINVKEILDYEIIKKSIDARNKDNLYYIYSVDVKLDGKLEGKILKKIKNTNIIPIKNEQYAYSVTGKKELKNRPVIVGFGPAGIFCGLYLAKCGYKPLIIERGSEVQTRIEKVSRFWNDKILDTECNVQFGEGGAGTFSDGKLNTLVKDKFHRNKEVLRVLRDFGGPEEIMYENKPHIGTDILSKVVKNIRNEIIALGGEILFDSCLTRLCIENGEIKGIEINTKDSITRINTELLVLAIGHSARDTFYMLKDSNLNMESKAFAVGVRIEHPQKMINYSQYGEKYGDLLPPAPYKLTSKLDNKRGVYTFCMCPGGYVVNASSEKEMLAVNGMSYSDRNSPNANSAIIVAVNPDDFSSSDVMAGVEFQRKLEKNAFLQGDGNVPIQLFGDFKKNVVSTKFYDVEPAIKGEYKFGNLREIFPEFVNESLILGIEEFDSKIGGFGRYDAILSGVESRTSSPIRILRDETFQSNVRGIYPCGEGAGYAGGITSAAMDGLKVFEAIISKYKSF